MINLGVVAETQEERDKINMMWTQLYWAEIRSHRYHAGECPKCKGNMIMIDFAPNTRECETCRHWDENC